MTQKIKYVPQSDMVASDNSHEYLKQQIQVVQYLNRLRQAGSPPTTLEEYQRRNNI